MLCSSLENWCLPKKFIFSLQISCPARKQGSINSCCGPWATTESIKEDEFQFIQSLMMMGGQAGQWWAAVGRAFIVNTLITLCWPCPWSMLRFLVCLELVSSFTYQELGSSFKTYSTFIHGPDCPSSFALSPKTSCELEVVGVGKRTLFSGLV